jgi:hypothetical protein
MTGYWLGTAVGMNPDAVGIGLEMTATVDAGGLCDNALFAENDWQKRSP